MAGTRDSLFTPKCTLVPEAFFREEEARGLLADVVRLGESDPVASVPVPEYGAVMVYSHAADGEQAAALPELYYVLRDLSRCEEYNKIVASWRDGWLFLAIAQGKSLQLCNVFDAVDFTTAEYFIFLALKKLQLNPELSVIRFRTPLSPEDEMSLYRYFKGVEQL